MTKSSPSSGDARQGSSPLRPDSPWRAAGPEDCDPHPKRPRATPWETFQTVALAALPTWTKACLQTVLGATVVLYVLNQKHLLPKPLSAVVSQTLFWPTLPITVGRRMGAWTTVVDDTVMIGGAPFGFAKIPERLYEQYNVRGVINLCEEYQGPEKSYRRLGMIHLRLPTVDHFEPSLLDLQKAVQFIQKYRDTGSRVYVHCRAGHGRSAAAVLAYLIEQNPDADLQELNEYLCSLRDVRPTLWTQNNIRQFQRMLRRNLDALLKDSPKD